MLEVIDKVKRRYGDATAALAYCDREQRFSPGRPPTFVVYRMICADEDLRGGSVHLNSPALLLSGASAGFMPLREAVG